jgi:hypothetical protein
MRKCEGEREQKMSMDSVCIKNMVVQGLRHAIGVGTVAHASWKVYSG